METNFSCLFLLPQIVNPSPKHFKKPVSSNFYNIYGDSSCRNILVMLGNSGGSFLGKRDCFYCTSYWKGRVLFVQQTKMELKSQICVFSHLCEPQKDTQWEYLLLIPSLSKHPHATTPFSCSLDISPMVCPQYWQGGSSLACLCLLAQISWNKAQKWPEITEAFPWAG